MSWSYVIPDEEAKFCTRRTTRNDSKHFFCIVYGMGLQCCPENCPFYEEGKPIIIRPEINLNCPYIGHSSGYFYCCENGRFGDLKCDECPISDEKK